MERATPAVDPITLEIIRERFITIVREMRSNMLRAAFSSAVCELHDMSCAVLDARGQLIALSEGDNPQHVFPILWSARLLLDKFAGDIRPGDVFLHNDPLTGGTHLNDIGMLAPLFLDGQLAFIPVVRVHFEDVGGSTPGSISTTATETFQEGVCIPMIRAFSEGRPNRDIMELLLANMRIPHEREGDFEAMLGTCRIASRRLAEFAAQTDLEVQFAAIGELLNRAEARMRARIRTIPDGSYAYEVAMDPRGEAMEPLKIRARVDVAGDGIKVDFTGTSPENRGAWNLGPSGAPTGVFMVLKALLDRSGPVNSGTFRPLEVFVPKGTVLNPASPVGFGAMGDIRRNLESAVMGALANVLPHDVTGETKSTSNQFLIAGRHPSTGRPFIFYEAPPAGTGGFEEHDGNNALRTFLEGDFGALQSVEAIEAKFPLRVEELAIQEDSAGAGRLRGGFGFRRQIRVLCDESHLSVLSDRNLVPPYGVFGGYPGTPNRFHVRRGEKQIQPGEIPGKIGAYPVSRDDIVISETSGGGGYGDPLDRDPALVLRDVLTGFISRRHAEARYGVVLRGNELDQAATDERRKTLRDARIMATVRGSRRVTDQGALRVCAVNPSLAKRAGIANGEMAELVTGRGAPLRCWIRMDSDIGEGEAHISGASLGLAGIGDGDDSELRPLETRAEAATRVWRARLEGRP